MKKLIKEIIAIIIICVVILTMHSIANAAETGSLTIKITPDASDALENKKVYVYLSLINFNNVEKNEPMALTGVLNYDKEIFENATFEGLNNWAAGYNPDNGNITLDTSSIEEDTNIAKITLDVKDVTKSFSTDIKINNITLTNGENIDMQNMNLNARVSITVGQETDNSEEDNNQDEENDNKNDNEDNSNQQTPDKDNNDNSEENVNTDNNQNEEQNNNQNNDNNKNDDLNNNNQNNQENNKEPDKIEKVEDLTTSKDPLPQTGVNYTIVLVIIAVLVIGILAFLGFRKLEKW